MDSTHTKIERDVERAKRLMSGVNDQLSQRILRAYADELEAKDRPRRAAVSR